MIGLFQKLDFQNVWGRGSLQRFFHDIPTSPKELFNHCCKSSNGRPGALVWKSPGLDFRSIVFENEGEFCNINKKLLCVLLTKLPKCLNTGAAISLFAKRSLRLRSSLFWLRKITKSPWLPRSLIQPTASQLKTTGFTPSTVAPASAIPPELVAHNLNDNPGSEPELWRLPKEASTN